MYSSPVCPPGYVKNLTKGAAISSLFTSFALYTVHPCTTPHYAIQTNRTTLHAVITMDGVYAGFAWSKNLSNCGF